MAKVIRLDNLPPLIPYLSEEKACGNKRKHHTAYGAAKQLAILRKKAKNPEFLNSYHCPYCNKWHVGNIIKPVENRHG